MNKVILIVSIFICQISYSQTTYQSLLINEDDFCGFSEYYFNNMDGYDKTMVIRMTVDSLISNYKIEKIIIKTKGLFRSGFLTQTYDSTGNRQFENNYYYKKKCLRKEYDELGKIIEIEKESFTNWTEIERYKYDDKDRLVEISRELKPLPIDTGGVFFSTICLSVPNKWKGEYDKIGNLISSETYWDNGKIYKQEYKYLSGKLKLVIYDSLEGKRIIKEYIYNKGLLESIIYFNKKNRKIKTENYKWQIINKGLTTYKEIRTN